MYEGIETYLSPLPSLCGDEEHTLGDLAPIRRQFFVTHLVDKPQNPIMDALALTHETNKIEHASIFRRESEMPLEHRLSTNRSRDGLWNSALGLGARSQNILSWDTLLKTTPFPGLHTPFLSEGPSELLAMVRYHVQPLLKDPAILTTYVTENDLMSSLRTTVLGTSSPLYSWDAKSETFRAATVSGKSTSTLIYGKDELISTSVIQRFLTIGTSLRRTEVFLDVLRNNSHPDGRTTVHAFTHALSSVLSYIRNELASLPPIDDLNSESLHLSTVWTQYAEFEEISRTVCALCYREDSVLPLDYKAFPVSSAELLSCVYVHLKSLFENSSPRSVKAMIAFILTTASYGYLNDVCRSVGLGSSNLVLEPPQILLQNDEMVDDDSLDPDDPQDEAYNIREREEFPIFFPSELANAIPRARKSLELLRAAQPNHPLLHSSSPHIHTEWFWTEDEVTAAWSRTSDCIPSNTGERDIESEVHLPQSKNYKDELQGFRLFDLEPGETLSSQAHLPVVTNSPLRHFLAKFSDSLPLITPTLDHLANLVLTPLMERTALLSGTLLSLFLSPSSYFNFHDHLFLLRSYLLLTSQPFRTRLEAACFSDSDECDYNQHGARALAVRGSKVATKSEQPWAVGLAPGLTERDTWPPGGADLSFYLRTVIVDAIEHEMGRDIISDDVEEGLSDGDRGRARIFQEADWRLGFAIRDLPIGTGREKWLNPLSIEALDFLYMHYKPPHPLDILITPDILSKYQRMFAFLLRLMRIENVVRALYRMTRKRTNPLFPTLTASNRLLLHFRYTAHSFVASLSSYVYDTAIRGNFDNFMSQVSPQAASNRDGAFADVFSLADHHSAVMDDILSACLLRSGQKAVGDLLRGCLELVLDLGILAGQLKTKRLEEYQAAPMLEDLFQSFSVKMTTLIKVIKALVEKEPHALKVSSMYPNVGDADKFAPFKGAGCLRYLLIQLDWGDRKSNPLQASDQ